MEAVLIASNIILWVVVVLLLVIVYALARQIGVLHERVAPVGALMPMNGPKIGERIEPMSLKALDGSIVSLGDASQQRTFIYFLSPGCPVCKSLLPVVRQTADQEQVALLFASDGESDETHNRYATEHGIPADRYVLSRDLGIALGVNKLPFAVLLDEQSVLRGRGLVNNREHIESLLNADEMDVSSLQEYLGKS